MKNHHSQCCAPAAGFTLIEVMIAVAIVGILSAIALPMYGDSIKRARITEATANLQSFKTVMSNYHYNQQPGTYVGACAAGSEAPLPPSDSFVYSCENVTANSYTVKATGRDSMTGFTYSLTSPDTRKTDAIPTKWGTSGANCWIMKKGGTC